MLNSVRASKTIGYLALIVTAALLALADYFPHSVEARWGVEPFTYQLKDSFELYQSGAIGGPFVYRLFVPWFIELAQQISGVSLLTAFTFGNFLFCALALFGMSIFSGASFSKYTRLASVASISAYLLFTQAQITGVTIFEGQDVLNLAVMLLGVHLISKRKFWWLAILIPLGIINRETPLFLLIPMVYLAWKEKNWKPTILAIVTSIGVYLAIRLIVVDPAHNGWMLFDKMSKNIPGLNPKDLFLSLKSNLYVLLYFFPVIALFLLGKKMKSPLFTGIQLMSVCFIIVHYFVGTVIELRLFLPLIGILLPFAIEGFFEKLKSEKNENPIT